MCNSTDLPEFEIISLLEEQLPVYRLRADTVYGYDQDDWLHTPLVAPDTRFDLTTEQIEETLKYFCKSCYSSVHTQHWLSLRAALGDTCRNLFFLFSNFKCRQRKWSGETDKKGHWILNWWDFISGTGVEIHGFKSEGFIYGGTFNPSDGSQKDNLLESAWIYVWFSWQVETHLTLLVPAGILFHFGWEDIKPSTSYKLIPSK